MDEETLNLDSETIRLARYLAEEDGTTPEKMIADFFKRVDDSRHVRSTGDRKYIRVKCDSKNCRETNPKPPARYGD